MVPGRAFSRRTGFAAGVGEPARPGRPRRQRRAPRPRPPSRCAFSPSAGQGTAVPAESGSRVSGVRGCVLIKFGEIVLKGRNRVALLRPAAQERRPAPARPRPARAAPARRGARRALAGTGRRAGSSAHATCSAPASCTRRVVLEKSPEAACATAVELLGGQSGATFAVRARRRDKSFAARLARARDRSSAAPSRTTRARRRPDPPGRRGVRRGRQARDLRRSRRSHRPRRPSRRRLAAGRSSCSRAGSTRR